MRNEVWYTVPKLTEADNKGTLETAIRIEQGFVGYDATTALGLDGCLTLDEAESLAWRLHQGIYLIKHGKLPYQLR